MLAHDVRRGSLGEGGGLVVASAFVTISLDALVALNVESE